MMQIIGELFMSYIGKEYNHGSPGDSGFMWVNVSHLKSFANECFVLQIGCK